MTTEEQGTSTEQLSVSLHESEGSLGSENEMQTTLQNQPSTKKLSVISKQYDKGNKGYLDETEKKLRSMDTGTSTYSCRLTEGRML